MVDLAKTSAEVGAALEAAYGAIAPIFTAASGQEQELLLEEDLLAIEVAVKKFRSDVDSFFDAQRKSMEALEVDDKPNSKTKKHGGDKSTAATSESILQRRSMSTAYRKRVHRENKAVRYILDKLSNLYSSETRTVIDLPESCMDLAIFLEKSETLKKTILHNLSKVAKAERSSTPIKDPEVTDSKAERSSTPMKDPEATDTKDPPQGLPALSAEEDRAAATLPGVEDTTYNMGELFPFLRSNIHLSSGIYKVLVVGKEGTGKTHLCNEIEQYSLFKRGQSQVHRLKTFGRTIGELEDNIFSLFHSVSHQPDSHHILLVDDFDNLVGSFDKTTTSARDSDAYNRESHASARAFSAFLTAMDSFVASPHDKVVLLCTAKSNVNLVLARFDVVHTLDSPSYRERRKALAGFLGREKQEDEDEEDEVTCTQVNDAELDKLAELSVGLSFAELAQNFRLAIMKRDRLERIHGDGESKVLKKGEETLQLMEALKESLQSFAPASLRGGVVDGYVDMRVLSSQDLLELSPFPPDSCPLHGSSCEQAWKELESNIVIPLCRAKELKLLLCNQAKPSVQGGLSCGIVLTGPAGAGKSTLAQHSAVFAAKLNPSIKLLEVSCTSMIHKEVGASEKAIHHLFECARNAAPCVVILDDVAIISSVRGKDTTTEGTMDRVLSTLLTELDGVERDFPASHDVGGIAVIGVTQNVDWVDPALLRPGRLGRILRLDSPDHDARIQIAQRQLEMHFGNTEPTLSRELAQLIAKQTEGLTGSSVISVCNDVKQCCLAEFLTNPGDANLLTEPEQVLTSMRNFVLKRAAG